MSASSSKTSVAVTGQQRLANALNDFKKPLSSSERSNLTQTSQPDEAAVAAFASKFNQQSNMHTKTIGARLEPFLFFMQSFGDVVGVYIQNNPDISALVWGTVKLLVQVAANYFDYFEKITEIFENLECLCPRIRRIGDLFQHSAELEDAILGFYAIIVEFCTKAFAFLKKSKLKQIAKSFGKPFDRYFEDIRGQLNAQRQIIDDEVLIASETAAEKAAQSALVYQQGGYSHRRFQAEQWKGTRDWQLRQDLLQKKKRLHRIRDMISQYDHRRCFINARDKRHPKTGAWFFDLPVFKAWKDDPKSAALWYHGIPGSGKSILASSLIEHIFDESKSQKTTIVYFFCDFQHPDSLSAREILSSLLKQLVVLTETVPTYLQDRLELIYLYSQLPPTINTIVDLLCDLIQISGTVYILVDGIDECPTEEALELLRHLGRVRSDCAEKLKIVISSRPDLERDIQRYIKTPLMISISDITHEQDLETYIVDELGKQCPELDLFPAKVKNDITTTLLKEAGGMFLWVFFQIQDIRVVARAGNKEGIYEALRNLPRGLEATYGRILRRINEERDRGSARRVFRWVSECRRALTLNELAEAISIRTGDTTYAQIRDRYKHLECPDTDANTTSTSKLKSVIHNCCSLVVVNNHDNTVQYAHLTVAKYISSELPKILSLNRNNDIMDPSIPEVCEIYLSLSDLERQIIRVPKDPPVVAPPEDWIPNLLPSWLNFLLPVYKYTSGYSSASPNIAQPANFNVQTIQRYNKDSDIPAFETCSKTYKLLDYVVTHWLDHFRSLPEDDGAFSVQSKPLERLVFSLTLPFPYLPLMNDVQKPSDKELMVWACKNDHLPLMRILNARLGCENLLPDLDDRVNIELATLAPPASRLPEKWWRNLENQSRSPSSLSSDKPQFSFFLPMAVVSGSPKVTEYILSQYEVFNRSKHRIVSDDCLEIIESLKHMILTAVRSRFSSIVELLLKRWSEFIKVYTILVSYPDVIGSAFGEVWESGQTVRHCLPLGLELKKETLRAIENNDADIFHMLSRHIWAKDRIKDLNDCYHEFLELASQTGNLDIVQDIISYYGIPEPEVFVLCGDTKNRRIPGRHLTNGHDHHFWIPHSALEVSVKENQIEILQLLLSTNEYNCFSILPALSAAVCGGNIAALKIFSDPSMRYKKSGIAREPLVAFDQLLINPFDSRCRCGTSQLNLLRRAKEENQPESVKWIMEYFKVPTFVGETEDRLIVLQRDGLPHYFRAGEYTR
ncbi:hypothetical protein TWF694_011386 [Orbilia ellipsospora]|uniref:NACHT domain-containing protein n=1 Tax=Orbilia ellipsospora TaxID=2528407 RepID=A0AAV9X540_9PEZI